MSQQVIKYPIFFTLEHVENGFILTSKDETSGLTGDAAYRKEVITEDKIDARIGKLLCLGALSKEKPIGFYVEATGINTYRSEDEGEKDELIQAKSTYYHMLQKGSKNGEVLCLLIDDSETIEVYGYEAERMARNINVIPSRSGNIPYLVFPHTKEGRKILGSCGMSTRLVNASHKIILQWIDEHPADFSKKP